MGGKWLAVAAALLLVGLILLWRAMDSSATPPPEVAVVPQRSAELPTIERHPIAPAAEPVAAEPDKPKKLDPKGDEFFNRFIEVVPKKVMENAVECYEHRTGSLQADQKLVLQYNVKIHDGVVSIENVHVKPDDADGDKKNTIKEPALESCFIQHVARTTWKDAEYPDYEWPDEIVLRPERSMKKYLKSNIDYVGEVAPKEHKFEKH